MTQTKLNFLLAKPFKQNKNNNNTDGTPLLRKRKQHKKRRKRKDLPHKNPSKVRLLDKRHKKKSESSRTSKDG